MPTAFARRISLVSQSPRSPRMSAIRSTMPSKKIASEVSTRQDRYATVGSSVGSLRTNRAERACSASSCTLLAAISEMSPRASCSTRRHGSVGTLGANCSSRARASSRLRSNRATSAASWPARNIGTRPLVAWSHSSGWRAFRFTTSRMSQVAAPTGMPFSAATSRGRNSSTRPVPSAPIRTGRVPITSKLSSPVQPCSAARSAMATASAISARVRASIASRNRWAAPSRRDSFTCSILTHRQVVHKGFRRISAPLQTAVDGPGGCPALTPVVALAGAAAGLTVRDGRTGAASRRAAPAADR